MQASRAAALLALSLIAFEARPANTDTNGPATYRATYRVEYNGRASGTAEISVRRAPTQEARYEYTSVTTLTGVAKTLMPNAAVEHSTFHYQSGQIVPLEFSYQDGRHGDRNLRVTFNWNRSVAIIDAGGRPAELGVGAGILDRGSLQVAVMHDLSSHGAPATDYRLAGSDGPETYGYEAMETTMVTTGLGPISAQRFVQRRDGASRSLVLWMAPSLSYLPVRIDNADGATSLILASVDGLASAPKVP